MNNWMEKLFDKFVELAAKSSFVRNMALILATCLAVEACATPLFTSHVVAFADTVTETVTQSVTDVFGTTEESSGAEGEPESETNNESESETATSTESKSSDDDSTQSETTQEESEYEKAVKDEEIENDYASGSEDYGTDSELLMMPLMAMNGMIEIKVLYKRQLTDGSGEYESSSLKVDTMNVTPGVETTINPDTEWIKSEEEVNLYGYNRDVKPIIHTFTKADEEVEFHFDARKLTVIYEKGNEDAPEPPEGKTMYVGNTMIVPEYGSKFLGYTFLGYNVKYGSGTEVEFVEVGDPIEWSDDNDDTLTLTAVWKANPVTINYDVAEGQTSPSMGKLEREVVYADHFQDDIGEASPSVLPVVASPNDGYHFDGWTGTRYDDDKKTNPKPIKIANPQQHELTAQKTGSDGIFEYADYVASFSENSVNVSFNNNGKTAASKIPSEITGITFFDSDKKIPSENAECAGYAFEGWSQISTAKKGDEGILATGSSLSFLAKDETDKTFEYYAVWTPNTYSITYMDQGEKTFSGKHSDPNYATHFSYDKTTDLDEATKTGYTFGGWYINKDCTGTAVTELENDKYDHDVILYAKWTPVTYTLDYKLNGGSVEGNPTEYTIESDNITLNNPVKTGSDFDGWSGDGIVGTSSNVVITKGSIGNRTYEAHWKNQTYKITYMDQGNKEFSGKHEDDYPETHTYGIKTVLDNPTKTGYKFNGWFDDSGCTGTAITEVAADAKSADFTLYAKWEKNKYTITFDANGGEGEVYTQEATYDEWAYFKDKQYTRNGFEFAGWDLDPSAVTPQYTNCDTFINLTDGDAVTIYAIWKKGSYSITYDLKGGELKHGGKSNPLTYGLDTETFTLLNPSKLYYEFVGWTGGVSGEIAEPALEVTITQGTASTVYAPRSYTASWSATEYTISYDYNNQLLQSTPSNPTKYTVETKTFTLNNPSREGYEFTGWTGTGLTNKTSTVTIPQGSSGNRSYTANWSANSYKYSLAANGHGTAPADSWVLYNTPLTEPSSLSETGYEFTGWYEDQKCTKKFDFTDARMPAYDLTLYAGWELGTYTISYDMEGHGTAPESFSAKFGADIKDYKPVPDPTAAGYTFKGWYKDAALTKAFEYTTMPGENTIVYAGWSENSYDFSFDLNYDDKELITVKRKYSESISLRTPAREGYTFGGWFEDNGTFKNEFTEAEALALAESTVSQTVYATWSEDAYDFIYDLQGGSWAKNEPSEGGWLDPETKQRWKISREYQKSITLEHADNVERYGYTFKGWYTSAEFAREFTANDARDLARTTNAQTVYAKWEENKSTITYKSYVGGTAAVYGSSAADFENIYSLSGKYVEGSGSVQGGDVTVTPGYAFAGWIKDEETEIYSTNKHLTPAELARNKTTKEILSALYTATFSENNYGVTFKNGDEVIDDKIVKPTEDINYKNISYTQVIQLPYAITISKEGFRFIGWSIDGAFRTPGQQVNCLTTTSGGNVDIQAVWTANNVEIVYYSDGLGDVSRKKDIISADSAAGLESVSALDTVQGYTFKEWQYTTAAGTLASYSDAILSPEQIAAAAWNDERKCYQKVELKACFKEIYYNIRYCASADDADDKTVLTGPFSYTDEIRLLTWDELAEDPYNQKAFEIKGATFTRWNEYKDGKATGKTFIDQQIVTNLSTGSEVRLVTGRQSKTAVHEYGVYGGGGNLKCAGESNDNLYKFYEESYASSAKTVEANPDKAYVLNKWQIFDETIGKNGEYRDINESDPVAATGERTKNASVTPKKVQYGGDEAYVSYKIRATYWYKDVKVNFHDSNSDTVKYYQIASVSTDKTVRAHDYTVMGISTPAESGNWVFAGWSFNKGNDEENILIPNQGYLDFATDRYPDYPDTVDLYAVWTNNADKPMQIVYHQVLGSYDWTDDEYWWIDRKIVDTNLTGSFGSTATGSTAKEHLITEEEAVAGQYYWIGWHTDKVATDSTFITDAYTIIPTRSEMAGGELYKFPNVSSEDGNVHLYAIWGYKPTTRAEMPVTVHYNGHRPNNAPVDHGETDKFTIATRSYTGDEKLLQYDTISKSGWPHVFGTNVITPVSADGYKFAGWYTSTSSDARKWVFNDDIGASTGATSVDTGRRDIYAKWDLPDQTTIAYYSGQHGTTHVMDPDTKLPTQQGFELVNEIGTPLAVGAVAQPDTGYHLDKWGGIVTSRTEQYAFQVPESWIEGADRTLMYPKPTSPDITSGKLYEKTNYKAIYAPNTYKVKFYDENGNLIPDNQIDDPNDPKVDFASISYDQSFKLPVGDDILEARGEKFRGRSLKGWIATESGASYLKGMTVINLTPIQSKEVGLKTEWEENTIYLSYENDEYGTVYVTGKPQNIKTEFITAVTGKYASSSEEEYVHGATTIPEPGYHFDYWTGRAYSDEDDNIGYELDLSDKQKEKGEKLIPDKTGTPSTAEKVYEKTYYMAHFAPDEYKVIFHNYYDEKDQATYSQDGFIYNEAKALESNKFKREGFKFIGWATCSNGESVLDDGALVKDIEEIVDGRGTGKADLYAVWANVAYYLAYDTVGGSEIETKYYFFEEPVPYPATPSKEGYKFNFWLDKDLNPTTIVSKMPANNLVYTASWSEVSYDFTYNPNGATWSDSTRENKVEKRPFTQWIELKTEDELSRTGYVFSGWYTDPDCNVYSLFTEADANALAGSTKSETVYAGWAASDKTRYKIKHIRQTIDGKFDDTNLMEMQEVDSRGQYLMGTTGGSTNIDDPAKRADYTKDYPGFELGDYKDASISEDGSGVAERKYNRQQFTFAYDMQNKGTQIPSKEVFYGADISSNGLKLDASPSEITGYEFGGWYTHNLLDPVTKAYSAPYVFNTMPANDVTVYAKWDPNSYTVRFNKMGGNGTMDDQPFKYDTAQHLYENAFNKLGYEFIGWSTASISQVVAFTDKQSVKNLAAVNGSVVDLFALWATNAYKITFDHDGGTSLTNKITATYSESMPDISTPSKTGYTFIGYYDGPDGTGKRYYDQYGHNTGVWDQPNDGTLYAKWIANTYDVIFDGNSSTEGSMGKKSFTYDVEDTLTKNEYKRTGYTYQGWADDKSSTDVDYADQATVSNLVPSGSKTIYAVWKANEYKIIFDKNGGIGGTSETTATYDKPMPDIATPSKIGYHFDGYATESTSYYTSGGTSAHKWNRTENSVLVAKWTAKQYTVKLNNASGSELPNKVTPTYDAEMPKVATPSYYGYDFNGYYEFEGGAGRQYYDENGNSTHIWDRDEENVTLYAYWTPKTYKVKLDNHEGTPIYIYVSATFSEAMPDVASPSKTGYTFGGYYETYNGSGRQYYDATGSNIRNWDIDKEDPVIHAKWTANTYKVHFDGNGATSGTMSDQDFTYDEAQPLKTKEFVRTGYTWQHWKGDTATYSDAEIVSNLRSENGDVATLSAVWKKNWYHVNLDPNFVVGATGGVPGTGSVEAEYDSYLPPITVPSLTGYSFAGYFKLQSGSYRGRQYYIWNGTSYNWWDQDTDNATIYGKWNENYYKFTYHYKDPNKKDVQKFDDKDVELSRPFTSTLSEYIKDMDDVNNPKRDGYTFLRWVTAPGSTTTFDPKTVGGEDTGDAYGDWQQNQYHMQYHKNYDDNATSSDYELYYEEEFTVQSNTEVETSRGKESWTRTGYTVPYWTTNNDGTGKKYRPGDQGNEVGTEGGQLYYLYAYWQPNTYYIDYDGNPGTASTKDRVSTPSATVCTYDQAVTLAATPSLPGYTFGGWYKDAACSADKKVGDASEVIASPSANYVTEPDGRITFYAKWTKNNYTVHFDGNGATSGTMDDQNFTFDADSKPLTKNDFKRTGYTWQHWSIGDTTATLSDAQSVRNLTEEPDGIVTLKAIWKANPYTVTLDDKPGSGGSGSVTAIYDSDMPAVTVPKYTGYTFGGYFHLATASTDSQYYKDNGTSYRPWNIDGDRTLIAKWTPNTYYIDYNGNKKGTMSQTPTVPISTAHKYDSDVILSSDDPTLKGYDFRGWFEDAECTYGGYATGSNIGVKNYTATANDTHTLYAKWTPRSYNLSFDANAGTPSDIPGRTVIFDQQYGELPVVSRDGYDFDGWYTQKTGGAEIASDSQITIDSDHTLYAHWQLVTYDIDYKKSMAFADPVDLEINEFKNKGNYPTTYNYETSVDSISLPKPIIGYKLIGWYESTASASEATTSYSIPAHTKHEDITLVARYDILELNALVNYREGGYDPSDASKSQTRRYTYNVEHKPTLCTLPVRPDYPWQYFDGWTRKLGSSVATISSSTTVTLQFEDNGATFTAIWTNYKYDLNYELNGGTNAKSNPDKYEYLETDLVLASPSKTGYTFIGWYDDAEFTIASPSISAHSWGHPITKYAKFVPNNYAVAFDGNGSTSGSVATQSFTYDEAQYLNTNGFKKTGYKFEGWARISSATEKEFTDGQEVSNLTIIPNCVVKLYAVWSPVTYKVNLNKNNGTGGTDTVNPVYDHDMPTAEMPTREGYDFTGYFDDETGGNQYYTSTGSSARTWDKATDSELYAHWNPHTYTVDFNGNTNTGGSMATQSFTYDVAQNLLPNRFEKTGYHFTGWDTNKAGTKVVYTDQKSVSNLTAADKATVSMYAVWQPNKYEVTLDNRGGSPTKATISVTFDSPMPGVKPPTRTGYVFKGYWDDPTDGNEYYDEHGTGKRNWASPSDSTLYAHWQANTYTVKFNQNGGTGADMATQSFTYDVEQPLSENTYSRYGYTYLGWSKSRAATLPEYSDKATVSNLTADVDGIVNLYAIWKANQYTITFEQDDATVRGTENITATFSEGLPDITAPSRNGFTFEGYCVSTDSESEKYYNKDGVGTKNWDRAENTVLHAIWKPIVYTITLHTEGGASSQNFAKATYSEPMPNVTVPTKTGYTFVGYYDATSSTAKQYFDGNGHGVGNWDKYNDGDVYARWSANNYTVTFDPIGGIQPVPATKSVTYDDAYGTLAFTRKLGYNFDGWYTQASGGTQITGTTLMTTAGDHYLYAHWASSSTTEYTVLHYGDDLEGTSWNVLATDSMIGTTDNWVIAVPRDIPGFTASPSDARNVLAGFIKPDGSLVLKLYYARNTYTITFASGSDVFNTVQVRHGGEIPGSSYPELATKSGYTVGWGTNSQIWPADKPVTQDWVLVPTYIPITYKLTYDLQGGYASNRSTYTIEDTYPGILLNNPTKSGYKFKGWIVDGTGEPQLDVVIRTGTTGDHHFKAVWEYAGGGSSGGGGGGGSSSSSKVYSKPGEGQESKGNWIPIDVKNRFWKLRLEDGTLAKNGWVKVRNPYSTWGTEARWYHFNEFGYMDTGWIKVHDDEWYYLWDETDGNLGTLLHGWHTDKQDGYKYYLDPKTGRCYQGWNKIDGKWYYFSTLADVQLTDWTWNAARYVNPDNSNEKLGGWVATTVCKQPFGSMWINKVTPDGHRTGPDGALIE